MISPKHVAVIMDGNGRWGIKNNKSRNYGHKAGIKTVEKIINASIKKKIKFLTLYTFSTENWKRPKNEINFLFKLLNLYIDNELKNLVKKKVKVKIIGNLNKFPKILQKKLKKTENLSNKNNLIQLNVALNYGSKEEIVQSIKKLNKMSLPVNQKNISKYLYTHKIPEPEILIRTGNTNRLSNFLLWQLSYTEIFFVKKLWPDFTKNDFYKIINKFTKINRNFGGLR